MQTHTVIILEYFLNSKTRTHKNTVIILFSVLPSKSATLNWSVLLHHVCNEIRCPWLSVCRVAVPNLRKWDGVISSGEASVYRRGP